MEAVSSQDLKFSGLLNVAVQQEKELSWGAPLISLHEDVAREQRQHIFGRDLLADGGHAHERP
jgi:hypothetical protein